MVHGNVLVLTERLDIQERELHRSLHEPSYLEPKFTEVARRQLIPILAFWLLAIRPEVWRDLLFCIPLARRKPIQRGQAYRLRNRFLDVLQQTRKLPRSVMSDHPGGNHHCNTDKAKNHSQRPKIIGSDNNVVHIPPKSGQDHQGYVD